MMWIALISILIAQVLATPTLMLLDYFLQVTKDYRVKNMIWLIRVLQSLLIVAQSYVFLNILGIWQKASLFDLFMMFFIVYGNILAIYSMTKMMRTDEPELTKVKDICPLCDAPLAPNDDIA